MYQLIRPALLALMLIGFYGSRAQSLPPLQPEQDACNALNVCGTFFTPYSYTGFGNILEESYLLGGCYNESNSVWFRVEVATAGDIVFAITPVNTLDDYDFTVFDITNASCSTLASANRIRCFSPDINSSPGGLTGLNYTSTVTTSGPGFGVPFGQFISANVGDVFLIVVDNYNTVNVAGFTLDFAGTTATFVGQGNPKVDSIVASCDYSEQLVFYTDQNIKCSSVAADGSDFVLLPANGTVATEVGVNCSGGSGYTNQITLTFSSPLPNGTYQLAPQNGTDGNPLLNLCDEPLLDTITFTVNSLTVDAGPDMITCVGQPIQLNAQIGGGPFGSTDILWTPATGLSNTTILDPTLVATADVSYTITVVPDGLTACAQSDIVNIQVLQGFDLLNTNTTICKGESVNMDVLGGQAYSYSWTPATYLSNPNIAEPTSTPDTTVTYTVTASYPGCADTSQSVTITVEPVPSVFAGPDRLSCYGDTLHLQGIVTPNWVAAPYSYTWTPGGGLNDATSLTPIMTSYQDVTYTLTAKTPAGCIGSDEVRFTVIPPDFATVNGDTSLCPRDTAVLRVTGGVSYAWSPDYFLSSNTSASPIAYPPSSTTFTVVATDANGCKDTQSVRVEIYPDAVLSLADSASIYPGETYQIDPSGNVLYFQWFPPAGLSAANIGNPVAAPAVDTRYILTAATEHGCVTRDSIDIFVKEDSQIGVPNAFTPGSEPNATLMVMHRGSAKLERFQVFNRWGAKVFETTDINQGWDGTLHGNPQPMGVYVYMVEAITPAGRKFYKQGNVTLLR